MDFVSEYIDGCPFPSTSTRVVSVTTNRTLDKLHEYAALSREYRRARDEAIASARSDGATLRQIADAANMTPQGVRKIIAKRLDNSVHTGTMDT